MADDGWRTAAIETLIEDGTIVAHKDGNYGSSYPRVHEFGPEGVPFLTAKLLDDTGSIDFDHAPRLSTDKADQLSFGFIESDDVLLSHNATVGRVAVVPDLGERVLVGTSLTYFRLDRKRMLPRYFAAYLSGRGFQNQLRAAMSHSTRNQVPITAQRKLTVVIPPLREQKRIAHILGTLDDKIELNRRMNRTLEAIARAIFKSWFIDFDPVIDNALASGKPIPEELRKRAEIRAGQNQPSPLPSPIGRGWQKAPSDGTYGVSSSFLGRGGGEGVADQSPSTSGRGARGEGAVAYHRLFPDEFQDSPLGKIPKGWEVGRLEEHIGFALGGDWGKETPDELHTEPVYCIRGTDLASLQQGELPGLRLRYLKPSSLEKRTLRPFDVVFEVSGGSPTQSTGRSLLINETLLGSYDAPLVCTNFCRLVRFTSEGMALFVSFLLDRFYSAGEFFAHETGTTTIKNFAFKHFVEGFDIVIPDKRILSAFAQTIEPSLANHSQNGVQSDSLSKIRDTLLPPLLSGRIAGPCDGTQGGNE
jgi:type I restriction enzyme S subunit